VRDLATLQRATGVGGEVDLLVRSDRLTDPEVIAWMGDYQRRVLKAAGYSSARGCGRADLCPAFALPDLFGGSAGASRQEVEDLLDAVPPYFARGVVSEDRRTASVAFGIRLMSVERQGEVIEAMRRELDPPRGVRADLAGPARPRRGRQRARLLAPAPGGPPARGPGRRRAAPPRRPALLAARARPARADRPGHGLVRAGPVRPPRRAQPAVRDPRRARGGHLHRVLRAAQRALPPRARARPGPVRRARGRLRVHGRRRPGVGAHGARGLRGARALRHPDAAGLRGGDGGGSRRLAARRPRVLPAVLVLAERGTPAAPAPQAAEPPVAVPA
jgi:hypothetical protein